MKTEKKFAAEGGKRAERPQLDAQSMRRSSAESRQRKRKPFARSDATIFFSYHSLTACTSLFRTAGSIHSPSIEQLSASAGRTKFPPASRPAGRPCARMCSFNARECFTCSNVAMMQDRKRETPTRHATRARARAIAPLVSKFDRAIFESSIRIRVCHAYTYMFGCNCRYPFLHTIASLGHLINDYLELAGDTCHVGPPSNHYYYFIVITL